MNSNHILNHVLVTGGAGFVGAHLCAVLLERGARVTAVDNYSTSQPGALDHLAGVGSFSLLCHDIIEPLHVDGPVSAVVHLACPASPKQFVAHPIDTLRVCSIGTLNMLELARRAGARFLLASSSEVYGDPQVHPQSEDYRGNVDPTGPRAMYDEGKRFAEAAAFTYRRTVGLDIGVVRPFNSYGPGMLPHDGRAVAAFCAAALRGEELTVHGDGKQTRTLVYIDDLVQALVAMLECDHPGPVNLGTASEVTMLELAQTITELAGSGTITMMPAREQDPQVRCPDLQRAATLLGWQATTPLREGLVATLEWMRPRLGMPHPAAEG